MSRTLHGRAALLAALALLCAPIAVHAQEFDKLHFRSIGPATMSGRISDLAIYEANPAIWYAFSPAIASLDKAPSWSEFSAAMLAEDRTPASTASSTATCSGLKACTFDLLIF
jgi:hypothetical protein